ncbi:MAG: hypothetical protein Q8S31_04340 [Alphaproteobacteria bacterium]|nr:hypothetical protein [Alphaproteobacteria bacterium]
MNRKILLSVATLGFISISLATNAVSLSVVNHSPYPISVTTELGSADLRPNVGTVISGHLSSSNNLTAHVSSSTSGVNPGSCTIDARKLTENTGNVLTITKSTKRALIGIQTLKCKHSAHSKTGTKVIDKIGNALLDYGRSK